MQFCYQALTIRVSRDELVRHRNKLRSIAIFITFGKSLILPCVLPPINPNFGGDIIDGLQFICGRKKHYNEEYKELSFKCLHASRCFLPAALVPFPCNSLHLSQNFPALWKVAEAIGFGLPQTIAHVVRPLQTAVIALQVLKEAGKLTW